MHQTLKAHYLKAFSPGVTAFAMLYVLYKSGVDITFPLGGPAPAAVLVSLAAVTAILAPLWYRLYFARRHQHSKGVAKHALLRFEKRLISMAGLTTYLLIGSFIMQLPRTPFLAVVMLLLYAMYFYYPTEKRIRHDMQIFRTK